MPLRHTFISELILNSPSARALRLVVIGPPASGKGTQARRLAKEFGLRYLSTGALLREHIENGTAIGEMARPILDRGGFLADACMCEMVGEWLEATTEGWILDGFPRSQAQAEFLDQWLLERDLRLNAAILLEAPLEVIKQRIEGRVECPNCRWSGGINELKDNVCPCCGGPAETREDDILENFLNRHHAYLNSAMPLVSIYRKKGLLYACDATGARDGVTTQLLSALSAVH